MKKTFFALMLTIYSINVTAQQEFDITRFGANVKLENNAKAIQEAINKASELGGGKVIVPAGNFITGPVVLKNNVELHIDENAVLLGSANRAHFSEGKMAVVLAENVSNVCISGKGTIDGQAHELIVSIFQMLRAGQIQDDQWLAKRPTEQSRPNLLFFKGCRNVKVNGVTLKNAVNWVQNYKECEEVVIDSIKVLSTAYWNNDGIDIVDSKNVKISNSYFNAADDAICLKSEIPGGLCENITIENCVLRSSASGFKIGTGSVGGFKNIKVTNLQVFDTYRSAIALETVDGGFIDGVHISKIDAKNTGNAIFIRLGHRNKDDKFSSLQNVVIDGLKVQVPSGKPDIGYPLEGPLPKVPPHNLIPASITGIPGHEVENVVLRNIEITYGGGADRSRAYQSIDSLTTVTENISGYPEFTMFGELPSWGLYIRHAKGIQLINFRLALQSPDFRPAFVFDSVSGLKLHQVKIPKDIQSPSIVYRDVTNVSASAMDIPVNKETVSVKK